MPKADYRVTIPLIKDQDPADALNDLSYCLRSLFLGFKDRDELSEVSGDETVGLVMVGTAIADGIQIVAGAVGRMNNDLRTATEIQSQPTSDKRVADDISAIRALAVHFMIKNGDFERPEQVGEVFPRINPGTVATAATMPGVA